MARNQKNWPEIRRIFCVACFDVHRIPRRHRPDETGGYLNSLHFRGVSTRPIEETPSREIGSSDQRLNLKGQNRQKAQFVYPWLRRYGGFRKSCSMELDGWHRKQVHAVCASLTAWPAASGWFRMIGNYPVPGPTVSAMTAPRAPSGLAGPTVESCAVWCSISELSSAPTSITMVESHIHISRPTTAPSAP